MKKSIFLSTILLILTGIIFGNLDSEKVDASSESNQPFIKQVPKEVKGTWYWCSKSNTKNNVVHKEIINAKKLKFHPYKKHTLYFLNPYKSPKTSKQKAYYKKTINWTWEFKSRAGKQTWYTFDQWQRFIGVGLSLNVSKHNGHRVLTMASRSALAVFRHCYKTPALAKQMGQKHYRGFYYDKF
ncbi:hypothetical protein [Apilactobacillus ozensis]|uniref:hypothetical protein n=1 Tax=Apilactobacillus ozensis TaxID=866801 RepID=UPI00200B942A|nr:hypothetical protein [Apilactobacillus ozensis]MCK8607246.1 hypothetical protein [Apilactobacillus ozensis]